MKIWLQNVTSHRATWSLAEPLTDRHLHHEKIRNFAISGKYLMYCKYAKNSNMNRETERNKSWLIKISQLLVIPLKGNISMVLHQYMRGTERGIFYEGYRIYWSYASQCAVVVAVNLQIDQTTEPKGFKALSRSKGSAKSKMHCWCE